MAKIDSAENAVYEYMKQQNRPYSAADVFLNLRKAHGKTAVVKSMENLAAAGKLLEKVYGKSKIYVISQSEFPDVSESELANADKAIVELSKKSDSLQTELKLLKTELRRYLNSLTTSEAKSDVEKLSSEITSLKERLIQAKESMQNISEEDSKNIRQDHRMFVSHWRKRKRITTDLMNAVLEGYPKSKKAFIEEVGIETDEEFKVSVPET